MRHKWIRRAGGGTIMEEKKVDVGACVEREKLGGGDE